ncbi:CvpA family protein [Acidobacteriota bacterium]
MNTLDVLILILLGLGLIAGLLIGVVRVLCALGALVAAIFLAMHFNGPAAGLLLSIIESEALRRSIAFAVIFLLVLIIGSLAAWLTRKFLKIVRLKWLDRLVGFLVGGVGALFLSSLMIMALAAILPPESELLATSEVAPYSLRATEIIISLVPEDMRHRINEHRNAIQKRLEDERPDLFENVKPQPPPAKSTRAKEKRED